jgi:hypothetical protein
MAGAFDCAQAYKRRDSKASLLLTAIFEINGCCSSKARLVARQVENYPLIIPYIF